MNLAYQPYSSHSLSPGQTPDHRVLHSDPG